MHRIARKSLVVAAVLMAALVVADAPAQQLTRVTPEVGEPGDLVIITGTGLGGVTVVRFGATVGGFGGFWVIQVAPLSVTSTTVTAVVPTYGNFLPPGLGSSPVGTIDVGNGFANSLPFFYMEQTAGQVTTPGLGTTTGGLAGRPVIGFRIATGAPVLGNTTFTLTLENAVPGASASLAIGAPATPPLAPYLDGLVGIDLLQPVLLLQPPFIVDAAGDVLFNIPIPGTPFNTTFTLQWVVIDPATGVPGISNGMSVTL